MERLYATVLGLRRRELSGMSHRRDGFTAEATDEATILVQRRGAAGRLVVIVARFGGAGTVNLGEHAVTGPGAVTWDCLLTSEDVDFSSTPVPPVVDCSGPAPTIRFQGPAAVIVRGTPSRAAD
jgi:hypothetical protein